MNLIFLIKLTSPFVLKSSKLNKNDKLVFPSVRVDLFD